MFSSYIIYSEKVDRYYIGSTMNLNQRLDDHNSGRSPFTKGKSPWVLKWSCEFETRSEAHKEEMRLKRKKSRKYIEWFIANG
ncbi:MAG: GIY-YIG nuclease family protein [Flavobacteriales bacterium]|nr:GIY-YIG nuclease family protein [Flavobacteriales bacterium]